MWENLFAWMLPRLIRHGCLVVDLPSGRTLRAGTGDPVHIRLHADQTVRRLALNPDLALGEAYMDGTLTIENDDLRGLMRLATQNAGGRNFLFRRTVLAGRQLMRRLQQLNFARRSRANVAHHYDLTGALYELFLDADKQYSCAYFRDSSQTLEQAQEEKKAHIARKLLLKPGMRVLDIGCGWGGLGLTLARDHGADVTGITLSEEQHRIANDRAAAGGVQNARFDLLDYRHVTGQFDRIVSVGMFEHVGTPHYNTFFRQMRDRLAPGGVALLHTIGRATPPGSTNPWLRKYIFPGGYTPALSEVVTAIEKAGLVVTDIEVLRLHYAETLRHWEERFSANIEMAEALFDARFCRMWRFYLIGSEMSFRHFGQEVFQIQITNDISQVPETRDYLYPARTQARSTGGRISARAKAPVKKAVPAKRKTTRG